MSHNQIGDEGTLSISNSLSLRKTKLQELNLSKNNIGEQGGKSLAFMLKLNDTLKKVYLHYNSFGKRAGEDF